MTSRAKSAYTAIHWPRAGGTRSEAPATGGGEESAGSGTKPPSSRPLSPQSLPHRAVTSPRLHLAGTLLTPKEKKGSRKLEPVLGARAGEDRPWVLLTSFPLRNPEQRCPSPGQDRSRQNPGRLRTCAPRRPAAGEPRQVCTRDKVCTRGTQKVQHTARGTGSGMLTPRMVQWSGHKLVAEESSASPGPERDKTEARATGIGSLHLGQARLLRSPSRCPGSATLAQRGSRGSPRGCFRRLLLQPPQAPACRGVHLMRARRRVEKGLCRFGIAPAKESGVPGPTWLERWRKPFSWWWATGVEDCAPGDWLQDSERGAGKAKAHRRREKKVAPKGRRGGRGWPWIHRDWEVIRPVCRQSTQFVDLTGSGALARR